MNIYEPFRYDNLPEKLTDNIIVLRQLPTETCEQRIQYIDLYSDCDDELRELGYCFQDHRYSIITGLRKPFTLRKKQIERIKKYYRGKCAVCGFNITTFLVIHHIIPRSYGGDDNDTNLLSTCPVCHKIIHMLGVFLIFSGLAPFSRKSPNSRGMLTISSSRLQQMYVLLLFF